jgi:hypothetical protein
MTGAHPDTREAASRPISVAELLARNGTIGSPPVTGRRRRRHGNSDAVTVAELTGEIPVVRDDDRKADRHGPAPHAHQRAFPGVQTAGSAPEQLDDDRPVTTQRAADRMQIADWYEPGPRWPESPPQPRRAPGPERSHYPRPVRRADLSGAESAGRPGSESGAEQISPAPVDNYTDVEVDVLDTDVRDVDLPTEDSDYVRSYLRTPRKMFDKLRGGTDEPGPAGLDTALDRPTGLDDSHTGIEADLVGEPAEQHSPTSELLGGGVIVLQSILAVAFGAGLFIAFDQLWRWNSIVALVLTVLVTLGLVAAVQAVRKTVDIGSTLIAVAVGLLVTLGPLALHTN